MSDIFVRNMDPDIWELFKEAIKEKHDGKQRGKRSFITRELKELMRLYIKTNGKITDEKSADPHITKAKILQEVDDVIGEDWKTLPIDEINKILDKHNVIGARSREDYVNYGKRVIARNVMSYDNRILRERELGRDRGPSIYG